MSLADQNKLKANGVVRVSGLGQVDKYGPLAQRDDITQRAAQLGYDLLEISDEFWGP